MAKNAGKMSFEQRLERLQQVVERLEGADLPLEESMSLYKEGLALGKACREQLDKARNEVRILAEDGGFTPFEVRSDEGEDDA